MSRQLVIGEKEVFIDDEDYIRIKDITWYLDKDRIHGKINGQWWKLHNYIMNTRQLIDHIDRNALNNRKSNLRIADKSKNAMNTINRSDNTSGMKGVSWSKEKKKWHVYITINQKREFLGYYNDIKDAIIIRIKKELELFKEFTNTNFLKEICLKYNIDYENISDRRHSRKS